LRKGPKKRKTVCIGNRKGKHMGGTSGQSHSDGKWEKRKLKEHESKILKKKGGEKGAKGAKNAPKKAQGTAEQ